MELKRRDFLKMTAALAAAGVSPSLLAAGKEQFTVYGAPAMPSVTIAVAALQGKLAKQADVSLKIWRSPDQLRAGVASGQFKVMMSPSNVGVNLRNQGQKVGMVNILTNGITQLMCKGSAITSPQDLVGKKILVPFKNDMPDIVLQALLKKTENRRTQSRHHLHSHAAGSGGAVFKQRLPRRHPARTDGKRKHAQRQNHGRERRARF